MRRVLLAGLGNPGPEYESTRHNIGFITLDAIGGRYGFSTPREKFHGVVSEGTVDGVKVLALKPMTYMNESGIAAAEAAGFYKIPPEDIIVIHDDIDLAQGKIRVKTGGGHGGHNGLKSIDSHVGKAYRRLRIGVGHPGHRDEVTGHVLGKFSKAEKDGLDQVIAAITEHFPLLLQGDDEVFTSRVGVKKA